MKAQMGKGDGKVGGRTKGNKRARKDEIWVKRNEKLRETTRLKERKREMTKNNEMEREKTRRKKEESYCVIWFRFMPNEL